jgi:hypothetical protein
MSLLHRTRDDHTEVAERDRHDRHDDDVTTASTTTRVDDDGTTAAAVPTKTRERTWTFAPGQLISFAVGIGFIAVGAIALIRAGIDGNLARPTVEVLTLSHTAWLGLAEVGLGVLLLIAGSGAWGRFLSVPLGALMVIAGILVVAEPSQVPERLAMESDHGWVLILSGALVVLASMVLPVWRTRKIDEVDLTDGQQHRLPTH